MRKIFEDRSQRIESKEQIDLLLSFITLEINRYYNTVKNILSRLK